MLGRTGSGTGPPLAPKNGVPLYCTDSCCGKGVVAAVVVVDRDGVSWAYLLNGCMLAGIGWDWMGLDGREEEKGWKGIVSFVWCLYVTERKGKSVVYETDCGKNKHEMRKDGASLL